MLFALLHNRHHRHPLYVPIQARVSSFTGPKTELNIASNNALYTYLATGFALWVCKSLGRYLPCKGMLSKLTKDEQLPDRRDATR